MDSSSTDYKSPVIPLNKIIGVINNYYIDENNDIIDLKILAFYPVTNE